MTNNQTITKIAIFQKKEVRKVLYKKEWWFSVIDIIEVLTDTARPRKYWSDLKKKLIKEGYSELSENIGQLKMTSLDGKKRATDCANTETIFRIIQAISSPKAEPFKRWLKCSEYEPVENMEIPDKHRNVLIQKINQSLWWHVTPSDPNAYKKRGKFLASTYNQASFYGRPNDTPEIVHISNPLCANSEVDILKKLFPKDYEMLFFNVANKDQEKGWYKRRIELDAKIHRGLKKNGYDSVVLLGKNAMQQIISNKKPQSIELNLCF